MSEAVEVTRDHIALYERVYGLRVAEACIASGLWVVKEDTKNGKVTGEQSRERQPGE